MILPVSERVAWKAIYLPIIIIYLKELYFIQSIEKKLVVHVDIKQYPSQSRTLKPLHCSYAFQASSDEILYIWK